MADKKMYEVIADKYTGKHDVYTKGTIIPENEVFGGSLEIDLKGRKDFKDSRGREFPDTKPVLKPVIKSTGKAITKKAAGK